MIINFCSKVLISGINLCVWSGGWGADGVRPPWPVSQCVTLGTVTFGKVTAASKAAANRNRHSADTCVGLAACSLLK